MHKRPSLTEALQVLKNYSSLDKDVVQALDIYQELLKNRQEFIAARLVVEIVDLFYHKTGVTDG